MNKLKSLFRRIGWPSKEEFTNALQSFSKTEWFVFVALGVVLLASTLVLLFNINNKFLVAVPAHGGTLSEGIIGTPRFINPILAISDVDRDMSSLIYSGLMRKMHDGSIVPDIAESYTISQNNLVYTFTIKKEAVFHDNTPVTADDIIFTIKSAQDPTIKSPRKTNWEGVLVEKIDDRTLTFTLKQPYSLFLENATLGILPKHIWNEVPFEQFSFSDFNMKGIGSGPYKVSSMDKKSSGIPTSYTLKSFKKNTLGEPYIPTLITKFYSNENTLIKAFRGGYVDQVSAISGANAEQLEKSGREIKTAVLPRVFGIFFNQNENKIFTDKKIIEAFSHAIDKKSIIDTALFGYGQEIDGPSPHSLNEDKFNPELASYILDKAGWTLGDDKIRRKKSGKENLTLSFSISTSDTPDLTNAANIIKKNLEDVGAEVELKIFDIGSLNQNIIRSRKYDALLFGQIIGDEPNFFAFWHSSQRNDPGLNIAGYTSAKADKTLDQMTSEHDHIKRLALYKNFVSEWKKDRPAIFIYAPEFVYVVNKNIKGMELSHITVSSDRFSEINKWFLETDKVWKLFIKNKN